MQIFNENTRDMDNKKVDTNVNQKIDVKETTIDNKKMDKTITTQESTIKTLEKEARKGKKQRGKGLVTRRREKRILKRKKIFTKKQKFPFHKYVRCKNFHSKANRPPKKLPFLLSPILMFCEFGRLAQI